MKESDIVRMARAAIVAARTRVTKEVVQRYVDVEARKLAEQELKKLKPLIRRSMQTQMQRRLEETWPAAVAAAVLRSKVKINPWNY